MRLHVAGFAALYLVASCASPEPEAITTEPRYDKFGNYECEVIPGTNTCVPDDDEDPCILPDGSVAPPGVECPPPERGDDDDDSSTTGGGRPSTPGTGARP
ncbi:hypothetical protein [Cognatishimia activa]|uniref:Lipoprotein n=1 Tax=Cognatishimia activa TaxID=1715691 RepID=A0A0P1ITI6_9RHOB|nr:hypothetical protein [Cognatishimia activa]MEE2945655.1 hypothetical protein [Pseudomonadota bacterium]CUI78444.1 hypothetical protein TA5113_01458 [Cognatishimia activa]CUK26811.1 hypothetical protein TA5114_02629 [Cognatishimia activa]